MYVCDTAVECNGDSSFFPDDWLMRHRWGKGKKDSNKLPNGKIITFLKVGGRTSAIVPSVQKKTGAVAGDVSGDEKVDEEDEGDAKEAGGKEKAGSRKRKAPEVNGVKGKKLKQEDDQVEEAPSSAKKAKSARKKEKPQVNGTGARSTKAKKADSNGAKAEAPVKVEDAGRRRSKRASGQ